MQTELEDVLVSTYGGLISPRIDLATLEKQAHIAEISGLADLYASWSEHGHYSRYAVTLMSSDEGQRLRDASSLPVFRRTVRLGSYQLFYEFESDWTGGRTGVDEIIESGLYKDNLILYKKETFDDDMVLINLEASFSFRIRPDVKKDTVYIEGENKFTGRFVYFHILSPELIAERELFRERTSFFGQLRGKNLRPRRVVKQIDRFVNHMCRS